MHRHCQQRCCTQVRSCCRRFECLLQYSGNVLFSNILHMIALAVLLQPNCTSVAHGLLCVRSIFSSVCVWYVGSQSSDESCGSTSDSGSTATSDGSGSDGAASAGVRPVVQVRLSRSCGSAWGQPCRTWQLSRVHAGLPPSSLSCGAPMLQPLRPTPTPLLTYILHGYRCRWAFHACAHCGPRRHHQGEAVLVAHRCASACQHAA